MEPTVPMMKPIQTYDNISLSGDGLSLTEVAAAPVSADWIKRAIESNSILFVQGELKKLGEGDPASNFRFKNDKDINNQVVSNFMDLFKGYHKKHINDQDPNPIVITSIPRKMRTKVFYIEHSLANGANGGIWVAPSVSDNPWLAKLEDDTELIAKFIQAMGISRELFAKMGNSTWGAYYRTYMADLISFVLMVDYHYYPEMFEKKKYEALHIKPDDKDKNGIPLLRPGEGKRPWKPREGHDYLYFKEVDDSYDSDATNIFMVPKENVTDTVYSQINELLTLEDSEFKYMIRKLFSNVKEYGRMSDHWLNDIDDPFTFYMFYNCYLYGITKEEEVVKDQIEKIIALFEEC